MTTTATHNEWTVEIEFTATKPAGEDLGFDLIERLSSYHASAAVDSDGGGIIATLEAESYGAASGALPALFEAITSITGPIEIESVSIKSAEKFMEELNSPLIPEVAALGEIAELAGVTRQRANSLVKNKTFPAPITELKAGKLWLKPAVENWLASWTRKPGAPKKEAAIA